MRQKYLTILLAMLMSMVWAKAENRGDILNAQENASGGVIEINDENFPDENFRNWLLQQDYGQDGKLTEDEINGITSIDVSSKNISSLKGIEYFTALTSLNCYSNQLKSLDVSKNTALTDLRCYRNQIKGEAMDALISGLPQNETDQNYRLYVYYSVNDGNVCTKAQVAAAKAKGWTPYYTQGGGTWYVYKGYEESIEINEENFPDVNFRNWLRQQNYGRDGKLTEDEINGITSIRVTSMNISSLKGIEYFTALKYLTCDHNQLTSLDVSKTALRELACQSNKLTSLDVSGCTALEHLQCDWNQLTSLDVSNNTALKYLSCDWNQLTSLDVSNNTALTALYCHGNQLKSLDVSNNTALKYHLSCGNNQLTSLDVSKNTALTWLYCHGNQLTSLDVSKNTALERLECWNNQLTSLDVSKNTALTYLDCSDNQLTSLDVSKNTALTDLRCYNNQLTSLDVSKNTALTDLRCYNNQLTSLDVNNTALKYLSCHSNQIKGVAMDALISGLPQNETDEIYTLRIYYSGNDGNVCTKSQVAAAKAKGWTPYYYDGKRWLEYEGSDEEFVIEINEENFPDENFRNWLLQQDYGQDGKLTEDEIKGITSIDVSSKNISSLKGIEYFTALKKLDCHDNQLTSLDVSKNTALTWLNCYRNQIKGEAMDALISGLPQNETDETYPIYVYDSENDGNVCTKEQVAAAKAKGWTPYYTTNGGDWFEYEGYEEFVIEINEENFPDENFRNWLLQQDYGQDGKLTEDEIKGITSIDVSSKNISSLKGIEYFTALTELDCHDNQLTSLDVSKNTALTWLNCYRNQIKGEAMDALISGLPQNDTDETYPIYVYDSENDGNVCTKEQVAAAKAKGWTPYYTTNGGDWLEYEGYEEFVIEINEENFPDENFRNWLLQQDYGQDGKLTEDEIKGITSIDVSSKNISSLKGIEYFTALTTLYCENNQLSSLDVSGCTALTDLRCENNQLTSLDVSKNTALTSLSCHWNQLTSLDVSNNTALTRLNCGYNQLTSLDVSKNTALTDLRCYWNQLTSLDVSNNTALTELDCSVNQLTSLDVSKNTALTQLYCGSNQLTSLDVSKNTALKRLECNKNQLTSLDVSKNTALTRLDCSLNQLTSLDVSNNTALTYLWCFNNQIKGEAMDALISGLPQNETDETYLIYVYWSGYDGNVCTKAQVAAAKAKGWTPYYTPNGLDWLEYEGSDEEFVIEINEENFPDENFRNWLLQQDYGQDGKLTEDEINGITSIDVSSKNISSLEGIENFTALTELDCSYNQLTSLDVSKNTALIKLYCHHNQLTSLDVSNNIALTELDCSYNQLTSLDVSKNTALIKLYCHHNQLTSLDVSNNTALTELYCYSNQIKGEAMDALISGLPQNETDKIYTLRIYYSGNDDNVCTKAQVAAAKAKGWTPYYTPNGEEWLEYEGSDDGSDGINAVSTDKQGKTAIYTLDGKRLQTTNAADLPKGIYIINGKKVIVK